MTTDVTIERRAIAVGKDSHTGHHDRLKITRPTEAEFEDAVAWYRQVGWEVTIQEREVGPWRDVS